MKHTICIPIFGIVLAMFACVATAYEICEEFASYYTYCDDGHYCCLTDSCCYRSSGNIFGGSGSSRTDSLRSSSGLSGSATGGIVIGSILFTIVLTICIKATKGSSKTGQGRNVIRPAREAPVQMISTGATPYTTTPPPPYSLSVGTGYVANSHSIRWTIAIVIAGLVGVVIVLACLVACCLCVCGCVISAVTPATDAQSEVTSSCDTQPPPDYADTTSGNSEYYADTTPGGLENGYCTPLPGQPDM